MINKHQMITRSKKKQTDNTISNDNNNNTDEEYDEIDENGNLKDFIEPDSSDIEDDFDEDMYKEEINRLRKRKIYDIDDYISNKKRNIEDIFVDYIINCANEEMTKNIKLNEEEYSSSDDSSEEDYHELNKTDKPTLQFNIDNEPIDDLDIQYKKLNKKTYSSDNTKYFRNLDKETKLNYIKQLNNIKNINNSYIPLKFKILNSNMSIQTKSIAISNIEKLEDIDYNSGEYTKMEQWISALVKIPFGIYNKLPIDNLSTNNQKKKFLKNSNNLLNNSIYGHREAKNNILQILAKWIVNPDSTGNILALQGPMGNGKTTLVKEGISKAIGRPFAFIALGGSSDASYFDGHNFTYEGSRWGRIVDILIEMKCMNPVIYFDELDKISDTSRGDEVIHLLTHITDLTQNNCYQDKYFPGVHIDLSKVLFIFSFNDESKINRILKDRMQVIRTKGFTTKDKINIVNDYLLKQINKNYNSVDKVIFDNDIITYIIENYTEKEEGVRNLKRCLENIISKINMFDMLYDEKNKKSEIELPFDFEDFKLPYKLTNKDVDNLLNKDIINDKPPPNMYL
tara:strand:+ start:3355 stop:5058 length:1704 start_codon:yes stop_codon:yes gene_type:complete